MKNYVFLIFFCAISILLVPLSIKNTETPAAVILSDSEATQIHVSLTEPEKQETISVFRTLSNKAEKITMFEYVCGSVAAEMPLAYSEEALKAQAVACYTNALRLKAQSTEKDSSDISDNTAVHQGYIDASQRKEKWGKDFQKYEEKLQKIVRSVEGEALYFNGKICIAAFSAISNGKTENAENLWGTQVPYLVSTDSSGDKLSPSYASTVSYTRDELLATAKKGGISINSDKLSNALKVTRVSEADTVLKVEIDGKSYTGEEVRKVFGLRSPTFTIKATDTSVVFSVRGYGHGIGMSQYGASVLAEKGYTYKQILAHYYNGAEIKKL